MKVSYRDAWINVLGLVVGVLLPVMAVAQTDPGIADQRRFQDIATKLDPGGDLFVVANTESMIARFLNAAIAADVGIPADDPHEQAVRETITRFREFLVHNGVCGGHGFGLSMVPREDGRHAVKCFIQRDYIDSNLPFWRGIVGWQPRRLLSLDFLPADTAMVRAGTPEPSSLWTVVESAMDEVAPPASQKRFNEWQTRMTETLGMEPEALIETLRDEVLVAIRFSKTQKSVVPTASGLVTIPAPSFLLVVGTGSDMLRGVVEARFSKHKLTIKESQVGDVVMRSATDAIPSLIPLKPAYASRAGFFLLGSSPDIVADALLAYRHKNGLLARPKFKSAFQGLAMVNNGIVYMSSTMGEVIGHIRDSSRTAGLPKAKHPATARVLDQLFTYGGKSQSCAMVIHNWKAGVMVMGNSSLGGQDILARLFAVPVRMLNAALYTEEGEAWKNPFALFSASDASASTPDASK